MKKYLLLLTCSLLAACNSGKIQTGTHIKDTNVRILTYQPAPGQFINDAQAGFTGDYATITSAAKAVEYAQKRLDAGGYVSLGGWGGTLVAAFSTSVPAGEEEYDLFVGSNAFENSSEPGVVWVSRDENADGVANDTWYELRGSEYNRSTRGYALTYKQPDASGNVVWTDSAGKSGSIDHNTYHAQSYFPAWIGSGEVTFQGTLLPDNVTSKLVEGVQAWVTTAFAWGYADNYSTTDYLNGTNRFYIADAVKADGTPANLSRIDFIKIQTGVNRCLTEIGELSTEVTSIGCYRYLKGE